MNSPRKRPELKERAQVSRAPFSIHVQIPSQWSDEDHSIQMAGWLAIKMLFSARLELSHSVGIGRNGKAEKEEEKSHQFIANLDAE
jgi:hypothetical protein